MIYFAARKFLPGLASAVLFGDRKRWGTVTDHSDPMWIDWVSQQERIYRATQKTGVGNLVNEAGYSILRGFDLSGKTILEVGPGDLPHMKFWNGRPAKYILADTSPEFLRIAQGKLDAAGVSSETILVDRTAAFKLPCADASVDIVISFYNLEHLTPLDPHLAEMRRALKPGGLIIGAIPAEGGLAWGLGRYFTTRRWFKRHTKIDLDKVICWEHPNFADNIMEGLDRHFQRSTVRYWPLRVPSMDVNLIVSFSFKSQG